MTESRSDNSCYLYDQLQRLTTLVQLGQSSGNAVTAKRITFGYNALGQRTSIDRFQSTGTSNPVAETDFTFDGANRLASLTHVRGSTTFAGCDYSYDPLSRITEIDAFVDGLSTYDYDQTSQLTGVDRASQSDETFGFDATGNRNTPAYVTGDNNRTLASPDHEYVANSSHFAVQKFGTSLCNELLSILRNDE